MADLDSDGTLAFVDELTKRVRELNREIGKTGEQAGTGIRKGTEETEKFGKTVERHTHHLEGMNLSMGRLGGLVRGFGAGAALATGAFQAMQAHVTQGLNLRNLSTDLGISAQAINRLRVQLSAAGVDSKVADQQISTLMGKLDELKTLEKASSVYKELAANDPKFADALLNAEKYGDRLAAIAIIQEKLGRTGEPRSTLYALDKLGLAPSTAAALNKDFKGRLIELRTYSEAELEEFNVFVTNMSTLTKNAWGSAMQYSVSETNRMIRNTKGELEGLRSWYNRIFENGGPLSNEKVIEFWSNFFSVGKAGAAEVEQDRRDTFKDRWEGEEGPATFKDRFGDFSAQDELDVQKDTNTVLQDIRNSLDEKRTGEGGGGGGASPSGGSNTGSAASPGATATGGGATPSPGPQASTARGPQTDLPTGTGNVAGVPPMGANVNASVGGPQSGGLAADRTRFKAELDANPALKDIAIDAMQHEGGIKSNMEQLFNYASMRGMTIRQALYSGQYGPMTGRNRIPTMGQNISPKLRAAGDAALAEVYGGSNITDYATDQGMITDPNGRKYAANPTYWNRKVVEGAIFSAHGERGRQWAAAQRERDRIEGTRPAESGLSPAEARRRMDKALNPSGDLGGAKIRVDFGDLANQKTGVSVVDTQPFKKLKIDRAPQAPAAGGSTADFNRFAFE